MIYNQDCIAGIFKHVEENSIDLIVTSPPYKEQDGYSEGLMVRFAGRCMSVLKDNSLCFINFGHLASNKYRPFATAHTFEMLGFNWIDTIVWVKNHYTPIRGNKRLNNLTEFIFMFAKGNGYKLDRLSIGIPYEDKSNIGRYGDKDLKCAGNVWYIPYETIQRKEQKYHKDRFPVELPEKCIKLSGIKEGSTVLDPFAGSMTTGVACQKLGMDFVGFEINKKIFNVGAKRLEGGGI